MNENKFSRIRLTFKFKWFLVSWIFLSWRITEIEGACYFPQEYQGEFEMQTTTNPRNSVPYSLVNITATSIPIWGNCHRRMGNNFILVIDYGGNSCIRCLHLKLRSKNVLQVLATSQETISKCYTNEESAEANCPSEKTLKSRTSAEIILFKTKDMEGKPTTKEYCPLDGHFTFNYKLNEGSGLKECTGFQSTLDSCPSGSTMNLRFRGCSFDTNDLKFDCLGHWEGAGGERYLALADNRYSSNKPQYRCALYRREPNTGIINIAISRDSTCTTNLHNASYGFETLSLRATHDNSWPPEVSYSLCSFPEWMRGNWEHVKVENNTITYRDHSSFKTYTIKCVDMMESDDKYSVFSRTQCGEEQYNCMRIQKRSNNILEFQFGTNFSNNNDVFDLCANSNFEPDSWITQGRIDPKVESACPISGEYTGLIPDIADVCAKLWSDCRAPGLMYYQVSDCTTNEIYEEREYQCLGHWREGELLYTYTQRHDVAAGTYECFVGSIISDKEDIYIKEAGEHCQRNIDPLRYGMKLIKQGLFSCIERVPSTTKRPPYPSVRTGFTSTTKAWNIDVPFSNIPEIIDNSISSAAHIWPTYLNFLLVLVIVM